MALLPSARLAQSDGQRRYYCHDFLRRRISCEMDGSLNVPADHVTPHQCPAAVLDLDQADPTSQNRMNPASLASNFFLVAFVANLLHWRFRKEENWFYFPQRGWAGVVNVGCFIAIGFLGVAVLTGRMPESLIRPVVNSFLAAASLYSIWLRQTQRRKKA